MQFRGFLSFLFLLFLFCCFRPLVCNWRWTSAGQDENAPGSRVLTGWPKVNYWASLLKTWHRLTADQTSVWELRLICIYTNSKVICESGWSSGAWSPLTHMDHKSVLIIYIYLVLFTKSWTTFISRGKHLTANKKQAKPIHVAAWSFTVEIILKLLVNRWE